MAIAGDQDYTGAEEQEGLAFAPDQPARYLSSLHSLIHAAPERLKLDEVVFFLLSVCYGPQVANEKIRSVETNSLTFLLGEARRRLSTQEDGLLEFWRICEVIRIIIRIVSMDTGRENGPHIREWRDLEKYILSSTMDDIDQTCRVLFLNSSDQVVRDEIHSRGSVDWVAIYPREVLRRVIEVGAASIIIVHYTPSFKTINGHNMEIAKKIALILKELGSLLHDYIITSERRLISVRLLGYLED